MADALGAVLVCDRTESLQELEVRLKDLSVQTWTTTTRDSAAALIAEHHPTMVFVEYALWDSAHEQFAAMARNAAQTLALIVVGTIADIESYVAAVKRGAFSFIAPPFAYDGLSMIVHSAAMDVRERRGAAAQANLTQQQGQASGQASGMTA